MARTPFTVEVLTPEGEVFNDEVEMVSTRTSVGSIGILANHQPLLAMLDPTELRLYKSESEVIRYAQGEGFLQMTGERALVLVDEVFGVDDLNASDLRDRLKRAEDELEGAEEGTEERRVAERDKRRYEAFLKLGRLVAAASTAHPLRARRRQREGERLGVGAGAERVGHGDVLLEPQRDRLGPAHVVPAQDGRRGGGAADRRRARNRPGVRRADLERRRQEVRAVDEVAGVHALGSATESVALAAVETTCAVVRRRVALRRCPE